MRMMILLSRSSCQGMCIVYSFIGKILALGVNWTKLLEAMVRLKRYWINFDDQNV